MPTITKNYTKCTSNIPDEINWGDDVNWTITADDGYIFNSAPEMTVSDGMGWYDYFYFTLSVDKKTATFEQTLNKPSSMSGNVLTIKATASEKIPDFTINKIFENCTSNIPNESDYGDVNWTITADDGYIFTDRPYFNIPDGSGGDIPYYFTLSNDGKTANLTTNLINTGNITIRATAIPYTPPYIDKYGSINVYMPTPDEISLFSKERFIYETGGIELVEDLGDYISKLHRVMFSVSNRGNDKLKVGTKTFENIEPLLPSTDVVDIDLGSVLIPYKNNDATDYNATIQIYLPFIGFQTLDVNTVTGKEVNVLYRCNIITGDAVAFITVGDIVTQAIECKPIQAIYYKASSTQAQITDEVFNTFSLYGYDAYILLSWYETVNKDRVNFDNQTVIIDTVEGFARFEQVEGLNNSNMTERDLQTIIRTLEQGVYL